MRASIRWNTEECTEEKIKNLDIETLVKCNDFHILKLNNKIMGDFAMIEKNGVVKIFKFGTPHMKQIKSWFLKTIEKKPQTDFMGNERIDVRGWTKPATLTRIVQWLNVEIVEDELKGRDVIFFVEA